MLIIVRKYTVDGNRMHVYDPKEYLKNSHGLKKYIRFSTYALYH